MKKIEIKLPSQYQPNDEIVFIPPNENITIKGFIDSVKFDNHGRTWYGVGYPTSKEDISLNKAPESKFTFIDNIEGKYLRQLS